MTVDHGNRRAEIDYDTLYAKSFLDVEDEENDVDVEAFLTQREAPDKIYKRQKRVAYSMTQAYTQASLATQQELLDQPVAGVIKRVSLKNFMCHSNFELNFGPRLNFIIGHNGSGKSSILTAISVCLGAKATETNRGNSLKDLIKEGTNVSHIKVVLANEGEDAFEPDKYGSEISIERTIRRDNNGSVAYTLRSEDNKKISSKKSDLDAILDTFNIGVSNPMTFLSQDQARSFLTATSDADKYKHFMRGTLMEEIVENLKKVNDTIDKISSKIIRVKDNVVQLRARARAARDMHNKLRESEDLRERQILLHGKYYWMEYANTMTIIERSKEELHNFEDLIGEITQKIEELNSRIEGYSSKKAMLDSKRAEFTSEMEASKTEYGEQKAATKIAASKAEKALNELTNLTKEIEKCRKEVMEAESDIEKEEIKIREKNGGSEDVLKQQVQSAEEELSMLDQNIKELQQLQRDDIPAKFSQRFEVIQEQLNEKTDQISEIKEHIKNLQSVKRNDPLGLFKPSTRNAAMEARRTRFTDKVLGPLGAHVTVKPQFKQWAPLLDSQLGATSQTFVVRNHVDQKTLRGILQKHHCDSVILVRRPEKFDYSAGYVGNQYLAALDCLEFSDEDAMYCLIDISHFESVALFKDRNSAQEAVEGRTKLRAAICFDGAKAGRRQYKNVNNAFMSDPIFFDQFCKLTTSNAVNDTSEYQRQLALLQSEYRELDREKNALKASLKREQDSLSVQIKELNIKRRGLAAQTYQLKKSLEDISDQGKLQVLLSERADALEKQRTYENSLGDIQNKIEREQTRVSENDQLLRQMKEKARGIRALLDKVRSEEIELATEIGTTQEKIKYFENEKRKHLESIEVSKTNAPAWLQKAEDSRVEAEQMCTEEEAAKVVISDLNVLRAEIQKIGEEVHKADQILGRSPAEIVEADELARHAFAEAFRRLDQANLAMNLLKTSLGTRLSSFRVNRKNSCLQADSDFQESLQFRNFSGNLDFDDIKKTLKMLVSTKNDKKPRHVDSLSGGEKSFSQIALLLATWKLMRSRIKGLDEFDVFMDQVNRKIGMRLMLKKLSNEVKEQTIFITPQDIGQIAELDEKLVRIHRIKDPRATS